MESKLFFFKKRLVNFKKGDVVVAIDEKDGWTRIRTENGNDRFCKKANKLTNYTTTRDDWEEEKQITTKNKYVLGLLEQVR